MDGGNELTLTPVVPAPRRRTGLTRLTGALLVLQVPLAGAALLIAGQDEEVTLAEAAENTAEVDRLRFAMYVSADVPGQPSMDDVELMTGEQEGDLQHFVMDFRQMAESMGEDAGELDGLDDAAMEMIFTPDRFYVRTPMFAGLAELDPENAPPEIQPLIALGDGWGSVDLATLAEVIDIDVATLSGGQTMDLTSALELLAIADGEVEERGSGEVRGVEVEELRTTITFGEMLEAEGAAAATEGFLPGAEELGIDPDELLEALEDVEVRLDVAVDDDGIVRRFEMTFDEALFEAVGEFIGAPADAFGGSFEMSMAVETFDFGDESIDVEEPTDAVDITPAFEELSAFFG